jgi:hypothetical protein
VPLSIILKVYDGGRLKLARAFRCPQVRLGTGEVELQLSGANVASLHALIELGGQTAVLRASSSAPLFLNGQPILAAPLRTGDLITLGSLRVMVELREPAKLPEPQRRARFQVIDGEREAEVQTSVHPLPDLQLVRELRTQEGRHESAAPSVQSPPPVGPAPGAASIAPAETTPEPAQPSAPGPQIEEALAPVGEPLPAGPLSGIGFALVEVSWGDQLLAAHCVEPGQPLTVGMQRGCDAFVPGLRRASVVTNDSSGWLLRAPPEMGLSLLRRGETVGGRELLARGWGRMDEGGLVAPLEPGACGLLQAGGLSLRVRVVPEAVPVGRAREDVRGVLATAMLAALLVGTLGLMHRFLPPPRVPPVQQDIHRPLIVRAGPPRKEAAAPKPTPQKAQARQEPGRAYARHRGVEGQAGSPTAPRRNLRAEKTRSDAAIVAESGLLKALKGGKGASDVFGAALGTGTRDALGHLDGPRVGDAHGDLGAGLKSLGGTGGGGDGSGLGLSRIGTKGIGGGTADYGEGRGALKGKGNAAIGFAPGKPEVQGEIDPELIRKVVHAHRAQIRACYELELNARPKLAGKVVTAWTIDPQGLVTESHVAESTLGDAQVERCVTSRIKTWRFPLPKGGGEVFVTYPFIFTRGG